MLQQTLFRIRSVTLALKKVGNTLNCGGSETGFQPVDGATYSATCVQSQ